MQKHTKMSLANLKIESFVTVQKKEDKVQGGAVAWSYTGCYTIYPCW